MNIKFYISFEVAKLLKEKGCDIERDFLTHVYKENGHLYWSNYEDLSDKIPAYTKAEAIDWLESKGIVVVLCRVTPIYVGRAGETEWSFDLELKESGKYDGCLRFPTRLEAEEAAIIEACKFLENGN